MTDIPTPIGREQELAAARPVLEAAASGPAALVLHGPAGIGKTTIWRALVAEAQRRGYLTMATRAVEAEAQLPFSGLVDLLGEHVDEVVDELPPAQRTAVEVALQRIPVGETPPQPLAVSIGVTTTLRLLSERSPLAIAVDDLPWLDDESARVLGYAVRRAGSMRLALLAAVRAQEPEPLLPEIAAVFDGPAQQLRVGPLGLDAIDQLVRSHLGLSLRRPDLARLERQSGGNPFHALEIARRLGPNQQAGVVGLGPPGATSESLARERIEALAPITRRALAAIAALGRPTPAVLRSAVPGCEASLDEAAAAGVLEDDRDVLRFTHPLLAAAAYATLDETERRLLHRDLAGVLTDEEEHAQHLALAIAGADAALADELDEAARHALARGATDAAAELSLEAARRTPDDRADDVHRRTLAAAELLIRAGDPDRARSVLEGLLEDQAPGPRRAAVLRLLADTRSSDDMVAKARILEDALDEAGDDHRLRSQLWHDLAYTTWFLIRPAEQMVSQAREAVREAEAQEDPFVLCSAYTSYVQAGFAAGHGYDVDRFETAKRLASTLKSDRILWSPAYAEVLILDWTDQLEKARDSSARVRQLAEELGDWDSLPHVLNDQARVHFRLGSWQEALACAHDAARAFRQNGQALGLAFALFHMALVEAGLGEEAAARRHAEESAGLARSCKVANVVLFCEAVVAGLELSLGNGARAAELLEPAIGRLQEAGYQASGIATAPELAEALILTERAAEAADVLGEFEAMAIRHDWPAALAACHRVHGLLATDAADEERAEEAFALALEQHARVAEPLERARTLLALGQSRRRFRRRGQARAALAQAAELFERLGARLWLERTRAELERTGHREAGAELSPTEQQIAELVAAGQTNREVAETLFMSPKTVEAHLTRIYRSLGVRGRSELVRALASSTGTGGGSEDVGAG